MLHTVTVVTMRECAVRHRDMLSTHASLREEEHMGKHEDKPKPDPSKNGQGTGVPPKEPPPGKHGKK